MPAAPNPPPDLTVELAPGLTLRSPVLAAAGTLGWGSEARDLADFAPLGAFVTPTLTLEPRPGSPPPRTSEAAAGLLHALGLPNPGLDVFLRDVLPRLRELDCPLMVSVTGAVGEWAALAGRLEAAGGVAALELNLCPLELAPHADPPGEAELLAQIAAGVAEARGSARLPLVAKLPSWGAEVGRAARTAAEAGADAVAVGQGFPGVAVRLSSGRFRLPGVAGLLSGPAVKPLALYQVWRAAQSVGVPVVGAGGVMTGEDALEFLLAGASAVGIGVASLVHPNAGARAAAELAALLPQHGFQSAAAAVGAAGRA